MWKTHIENADHFGKPSVLHVFFACSYPISGFPKGPAGATSSARHLDTQLAPLGLVRVGLVHPVLRINEGWEVVNHQVFVAS